MSQAFSAIRSIKSASTQIFTWHSIRREIQCYMGVIGGVSFASHFLPVPSFPVLSPYTNLELKGLSSLWGEL
jgi:hypothetical protein